MCELMGLSFDRPVSADISIREFAGRDEQNADGWGLAWYPDRSAAVVKEPISWRASKHTQFLANYHALRSSLYIAHVRHRTTGGEPTHADTHPFTRELGGHEYAFAHNGTLALPEGEFPLGRYRPVGRTDSEYAFCWLLDALARNHGNLSGEESWHWLFDRLHELNRHGQINCLLSDGRSLFCYRDAQAHKNLTWSVVAVDTAGMQRFEDAEVQVEVGGAPCRGILVASNPLGSHAWEVIERGQLLVVREGAIQCRAHAAAAIDQASR